MTPQTAMGATMMCSFGLAPSTMAVLPLKLVFATTPAATVTDVLPVVNLPPFGACTSMANPMVAAATAAALGVLTPMPCIPVPAGPWLPGSPKVLIKGTPALNMTSKCMCSWGGVIQILNPGQMKMLDA